LNPSSYDEIAGLYDELWADWYLPAAMPALERLFFSEIKAGATVIDLCCGPGHVTKELVQRGYAVTGVDNSAELIGIARTQLPGTDFRVLDARALDLPKRYDAALSTFDSLNHILRIEELQDVFSGVQRALKRGGLFVFDMNLEEAYSLDMRHWSVDLKDTSVSMVRGLYDPVTHLARTELIWFTRLAGENCWRQHKSLVEQRCYPKPQIMDALRKAGFRGVDAVSSDEAGITSDLGHGRYFFSAHA
jgi:SAM-dependent methyltransferase